MKRFFLFLCLLAGILASAQQKIYTCPMHPEVTAEAPGKCPKCGMALVPKASAKKEMPPMRDDTETREIPHQHNEKNSATEDFPKLNFEGRTVRYDLYVKDTLVNFTGKKARAIAINGKITAPTLYFKEGDTAEIYLHNGLRENTGLHWHGVTLPNEMDGVPYLTTAPVKPGETHLYKFKVVQNGTYWYHFHEKTQEQIGGNGMLVFSKRETPQEEKFNTEIPVVLTDWTDENPNSVMRRLHSGSTEWYEIRKNAVQSYAEAIRKGYFCTKLLNEWKRMEAMDVSDVWYQKFLANGEPEIKYAQLKTGDRVRLRIANGSGSSYFWLGFGGGKFKVIASDGNMLEPVETDRLIMGISETYDIEVTLPENKQYELRATAEDRTGYSSIWLGSGEKVAAPTLPRLNLFEGMKMMNAMMKTSGDMKPMTMKMGNRAMDMNEVMYPEISPKKRMMTMQHMQQMMGEKPKSTSKSQPMDMAMKTDMHSGQNPEMQHAHAAEDIQSLGYGELRAPDKTALPEGRVRELHFTLEGNMRTYLWTLDNRTVTETDKILIRKGEVLRVSMYNNSMMRHPMHLHGHDFRLLNAQGDYAPLKNVVDIMPMETDVIEFAANQDGDWFFHCHLLYHMMSGMGRVFSYENSAPNTQLPNPKQAWRKFNKENFMLSTTAMAEASTNSLMLESMTMIGPRWMNINEFHGDWKFQHYDANLRLGRFLGKFQWALPYIGFRMKGSEKMDMAMPEHGMHGGAKTWFGQRQTPRYRNSAIAGLRYTLPWLVNADLSLDMGGKMLLELSREDIPVSPRIRGSFMLNSDKEFRGGLRYILGQWLSVGANYSTRHGWGAGLRVTY